jgi:hypothetical protein
MDCYSLTSVVLGDSVTSIGEFAFSNCNSLTTIYCEAESQPSGWDSKWNAFGNYGRFLPVVWDCKNNDMASDGYIYAVIDGVRYAIKDAVATVVRQPSNIVTANIPSSFTYKDNLYAVTTIENYAFLECSSLTEVYYTGTASDWSKISISSGNTSLTGAMCYYYSENEPTVSGNYWHYVDGVVTKW